MQQKYTVGHRDFGIDKNIINVVVETCPVCLMGTRFKRSNGIKNGSSCHLVNDKLPHLGFNGKCSSDTLSMVANVPDSKCMWFDKSGRPIDDYHLTFVVCRHNTLWNAREEEGTMNQPL